ncbi:MAG TPA: ABC transporter permease [Streptosporangiaceae bacterium]|jgi:peptide/nickel transport system permease protein
MAAYILRRIAAGIVVLYVATFLLYLLVAVSGDPLAQLKANPKVSPQTIAIARHQLGLDKPILERYWLWFTGVLHGNFGTSTTGQVVGSELWPRMLVTLHLVIPAVILSIIIGILLGVSTAVKQYSIMDHVNTGLAYLFFSTPVFVVAILLKDFLAVDVNKAAGHTILYTLGQSNPGTPGGWGLLVDETAHTVLPVIALVVITYATWSRYQRASMLDVLNSDYVKLARAKGLSRRRVLYVHALRNALIPVTTVIALDFAALLGGTLITEIVFGWNGMGKFFFNALTGQFSPDINTVMAWLLVNASAVIIFNILADISYGLLDPRIRYA